MPKFDNFSKNIANFARFMCIFYICALQENFLAPLLPTPEDLVAGAATVAKAEVVKFLFGEISLENCQTDSRI